MTTQPVQLRQRQVDCPACGTPTEYGPHNPWRPFCSEWCRRADLGAWASERYRMPAAPPDDPDRQTGDSR
ncbi:MAG: DNA gyrase inhibitor YacG [Burkholderiaceae bacterium]|nr:DNA gyrase inhibitor YacG [Aquabacterium sp.]NUP84745.1 DNA gyrase inhibitor YacG [Burkholderiaceae bacterium]